MARFVEVRGLDGLAVHHEALRHAPEQGAVTKALRKALVQRHGSRFQHHDGGMEDRKGLLESTVAWVGHTLPALPALAHRQRGQFAAAVAGINTPSDVGGITPVCRRHG